MLCYQDIPFWNWSFEDYRYKKKLPFSFVGSCIKWFLNEWYTPKVMVSNVSKRNVFVELPFLGSSSFQVRKKLQKLFSDKLTSCNLKVVFTSPARVKRFFTLKNKLPKMLLLGLLYKYECGSCNATYYGKVKRHFNVQICKHLGVSHLIGQNVKIEQSKNISYVVTNLHPR